MPPIEIPNGASDRDARSAAAQQVPSETPVTERAADPLGESTAWAPPDAEQPSEEFDTRHDGLSAAPPARSVRRSTARRASTRRATARSHQSDTEASIIDFLALHPGSTTGDLAKRLNLDPEGVAHRLTQLVKTGAIKKAAHGYDIT
jgi:hypothetical protein